MDWTDAALSAMAVQGTAGVNVEQLARDLGATKGSFYHHFRHRGELLQAALARWEEIVADDLADARALIEPRQRLMTAGQAGIGTGLDGSVDLALAADRADPEVAASLQRVNGARLEFLAATLEELGFAPAEARRRAVTALAGYLGLFQLQSTMAERPHDDDLRSLVSLLIDTIVSR